MAMNSGCRMVAMGQTRLTEGRTEYAKTLRAKVGGQRTTRGGVGRDVQQRSRSYFSVVGNFSSDFANSSTLTSLKVSTLTFLAKRAGR